MKFKSVLVLLLILFALFVAGSWSKIPEPKSDEVKIEKTAIDAVVTLAGDELVIVSSDALVELESNDLNISESPPIYNWARKMNTVDRISLNFRQKNTKQNLTEKNKFIRMPILQGFDMSLILRC